MANVADSGIIGFKLRFSEPEFPRKLFERVIQNFSVPMTTLPSLKHQACAFIFARLGGASPYQIGGSADVIGRAKVLRLSRNIIVR